MDNIVYNHRRIMEINAEELKYKDDNNQIISIDFIECRRNWVKYINNSEDFDVTDLTEEKTNCVGWRDIFDKPPYIEFFSEPRIRFNFNDRRTLYEWLRKRNSSKGKEYFRKLQFKINENGWKTFDLG